MNNETIIKINPGGGPLIMTTLRTLTQAFPNSVIARQFAHLDMIPKDEYGNYFIDTDPFIFNAVLNVLRQPELIEIPPVPIDEERWARILEYWGLLVYKKEEEESVSKLDNIICLERNVVKQIIDKKRLLEDTRPGRGTALKLTVERDRFMVCIDQPNSGYVPMDINKAKDRFPELVHFVRLNPERFAQHFRDSLPDCDVCIHPAKDVLETSMIIELFRKPL